jgi:hypothetical protein
MEEGKESRYRILGRLGESGWGPIYQARDDVRGLDVAVRLMSEDLSPEMLVMVEDAVRRQGLVAAEMARLAARSRTHEGPVDPAQGLLVLCQPLARMSGHWVLVQDLAAATSIRRHLADDPYPASVAIEVIEQLARGLQIMSATPDPATGQPVGLLARHLSPGRVLVSYDGRVRLLEAGIPPFDLAAAAPFVAPERLMSAPGRGSNESPASDVYALGMLARQLVTGREPMVGAAADDDLEFDEDDAATELVDDATRELMGLASRMCDPDPSRRPTADEVAITCGVLRKVGRGPSLRQWAGRMPTTPEHVPDQRSGMALVFEGALGFSEEDTPTEDVHTAEVQALAASLVSSVATSEREGTPQPHGGGRVAGPRGRTVTDHDDGSGGVLTPLLIGGAVTALVLIGLIVAFVLIWWLTRPPTAVEPEPPPAAPAAPVEAAPPPALAPPVEPAPEPEPEPEPVEVAPDAPPTPPVKESAPPKPKAPAPQATGAVELSGTGSVTLSGSAGKFAAPGAVPPGTYDILVSFGGAEPFASGSVTIEAGQTKRIECKEAMGRCFVR